MGVNIEKFLEYSSFIIVVSVLINTIYYIIQLITLKLTHLGAGNMKADGSEQILFEHVRNEPFTLSGYVNLKNMKDGDKVTIREYVKMAIDDEFYLYEEATYMNKQEKPIIYIRKLPALRGIRITLQQTEGTFKYFPFEFYMGVTG